eukprot:1854057-Amphidinium_carterae.1
MDSVYLGSSAHPKYPKQQETTYARQQEEVTWLAPLCIGFGQCQKDALEVDPLGPRGHIAYILHRCECASCAWPSASTLNIGARHLASALAKGNHGTAAAAIGASSVHC